MKVSIGFWFASFIICTGLSAQPIVGHQRPIAAAHLTEVTPDGREVTPGYEKSATLNGDNAQDPASLVFKEESPTTGGTNVSQFVITKKSPAGCGSVKYVAQEKAVGTVNRTLEVVDHSERICDDYQPYQWEMILKQEGQPTRHLVAPSKDFDSIQ